MKFHVIRVFTLVSVVSRLYFFIEQIRAVYNKYIINNNSILSFFTNYLKKKQNHNFFEILISNNIKKYIT